MTAPNAFDFDSMAAEIISDLNGGSAEEAAVAEQPQVVDGLVMPPADPPAAGVKIVADAPVVAPKAPVAVTSDTLVDEPSEDEEGEESDEAAEATPAEQKLPVPDPKFPNVQYEIRDAEGEALQPPEGLSFTFKADGGKVFENIPLPHVIQLAQRGIYNQRVHDEVQEFRAAVPEIRATLADYETTITSLQQQVERLLGDDEYLFEQREALERANTPEARLERAERALRERDAAAEGQSTQQAISSYVDEQIAPQFETILAQHGEHVSWEEVWGKYDQMLMPFKRNGIVPPEKIGIMGHVLVNELIPWVEATVEKRQSKAQAATATKASDAARILAAEGAAKRKAAEAATLQRRQFVRRTAVAPTSGTPAAGMRPPQGPVDYTNVLDSIMQDAANYGR
jgi:hypothetical protein